MPRHMKEFPENNSIDYRRRIIELQIPLKNAAASMEVTGSYLCGVLRGRVKLTPKMRLRLDQYLESRERRKGCGF